jgi:large subunit ribosomal protein L29
MKLKEYRKKLEEMTQEELKSAYKNAVDELFRLRFQLVTGHLEDPTKVRQLKRNIARIQTIITEKENGSFWKKRNLEVPKVKGVQK